jgi:hypothetical protein
MAGLLVTAFVPDEWIELRGLLADIVPEGTGLYRWDEWWFEDGSRLRSAAIVRNEGGPSIDDIAAHALDRARARGWKSGAYEDAFKRTSLEDAATGKMLRIGQEPLPPRVVIDLHEPRAPIDVAQFPPVEVMLHLTSRAGASAVRKLHRRAELDLERHDKFFPPTTELSVAGPYDRVAMCQALDSTGFAEDGDVWSRDTNRIHAEVRLRDDIEITLVPSVLRSLT